MGKIRVLAFVDGIRVGGQELFVRDICKHFDKDIFELMIGHFSIGEIEELYTQVGVPCFNLGEPMNLKQLRHLPKTLKALVKLISVIRREQVEVIQTNGARSHIIGSLAVALTGIKQIYIPGSLMKRGLLFRIYSIHCPLMRLDRFTSLYVALLPEVTRELLAQRVSSQKIRLIIWGVDTDRFRPGLQSQGVRSEFGIEESQVILGVVSRMVEDRGHLTLVHAVNRLLAEHESVPIRVLFVGNGPKREEFVKVVDDLGLSPYFYFTGFREDVERIINAIDIAVLTPKDPIGSSFLREAMACAKPIITTDGESGAQRDWIMHKYNGLLIQPHNMVDNLKEALAYLIEHPGVAGQIGTNARAYIEEHMSLGNSIAELQRLFVNLYREQVNPHQSFPPANN